MRLENVLALTQGVLVNSPFVNSFSNIVFDSKMVRRGDLFIAFDEHAIEDAIFNGAYGILFQRPTQISDTEIAWIKVNNLEKALEKLLRFILLEKQLRVYSCNEILLELALQVTTDNSFVVVHGDIQTIFKQLNQIENEATLLFCPQKTSSDIFTEFHELPQDVTQHIEIIEQTLFETSFIYAHTFYERQLLSPLFIPYLEQLLSLLKALHINFRLKKFMPLEHFEAVFINKHFEIKEFGSTDRVLIFEKNTDFIEEEISFLHTQAPWAKSIIVSPKQLQKQIGYKENITLTYDNTQEIIPMLSSCEFHFALVIGVEKSFIQNHVQTPTQPTLFDF